MDCCNHTDHDNDLHWEVDQPMGGCRTLHSSASQSDRRQQQSCIPEDQLEGLHGEDYHPAVPITYTRASHVAEIRLRGANCMNCS